MAIPQAAVVKVVGVSSTVLSFSFHSVSCEVDVTSTEANWVKPEPTVIAGAKDRLQKHP